MCTDFISNQKPILKIKDFGMQGKGLAFNSDITDIGDVIITESPLIAYKHMFSKLTTLSCDYCFKCIGSFNDYINYLSRIYSKNQFKRINFEQFNFKVSDFIQCPGTCNSYFCSNDCYQKSISNGHNIICQMDDLSKNCWQNFLKYSMGISETFIFAGLIVVQIIYKFVDRGYSIEDQMNYYLEFYNKPWCEIKKNEYETPGEYFNIALTLLKKSLLSYTTNNKVPIDGILSSGFYSRIMGMIELVALDIEVESDYNSIIFENVDKVDNTAWKQLLEIKELICGIDTNSLSNYDLQQYKNQFGEQIVPYTLGLGIFNTFSRMNHSCAPNLDVYYHRNFLINGKLIKPVKCGDQAYISYIDENLPLCDRKRLLSKYLFQCNCNKCKSNN